MLSIKSVSFKVICITYQITTRLRRLGSLSNSNRQLWLEGQRLRMNISDGERDYIVECITQGCRADGRGLLACRRAITELDVVPQATGSARVRLGETDVFVGVKVELGEPHDAAPDCGRIEFFVDYAPCGTQDIDVDAALRHPHLGTPLGGRI